MTAVRVTLGIILLAQIGIQSVAIGQLMYDINPFSHSSTACYKSNWFLLKNLFKIGLPLYFVLKPDVGWV